jgi:hypothetical protein
MSKRTKVETWKVGAKKEDPATRLDKQPVRSVNAPHGSTAAKRATREALEKLGYKVRSVSFTEEGILAYVAGDPPEKFSSARSGPGRHRRSKTR